MPDGWRSRNKNFFNLPGGLLISDGSRMQAKSTLTSQAVNCGTTRYRVSALKIHQVCPSGLPMELYNRG
jgi:hypothetical protein